MNTPDFPPNRVALLALALMAWRPDAAGSETPVDRGLDAAIESGRTFLIASQREDGAICDPRNPLFESWETVAAATALIDSGAADDAPVRRALAYLSANENAAGLLCHNRRCKAGHCLETTAEYLQLLSRQPEGITLIQPRLAGVVALQQPTGEWRIGNPDVHELPDAPSATAFVLTMLEQGQSPPRDADAARDWLLERQNPAGDWGQHWEYYGCPAYQLWPVMRALAAFETPAAGEALERAAAYIREGQRPDGSWHFVDRARPRGVSPELQTALMLSALRYADPVRNREAIDRGAVYLLSRQRPDGSWDGGVFPITKPGYRKSEALFASARAVSVLAWYRARFGSDR